MLWSLLQKNYNKYIRHFGETPWIYNLTNLEYKKWLYDDSNLPLGTFKNPHEYTDYGRFKKKVADKSRKMLSEELKIPIS